MLYDPALTYLVARGNLHECPQNKNRAKKEKVIHSSWPRPKTSNHENGRKQHQISPDVSLIAYFTAHSLFLSPFWHTFRRTDGDCSQHNPGGLSGLAAASGRRVLRQSAGVRGPLAPRRSRVHPGKKVRRRRAGLRIHCE